VGTGESHHGTSSDTTNAEGHKKRQGKWTRSQQEHSSRGPSRPKMAAGFSMKRLYRGKVSYRPHYPRTSPPKTNLRKGGSIIGGRHEQSAKAMVFRGSEPSQSYVRKAQVMEAETQLKRNFRRRTGRQEVRVTGSSQRPSPQAPLP